MATVRKYHVLLVEDDAESVILVRTLLEHGDTPIDLKVATSMADGLAMVSAHQFDLVLLDLNLGDSSGLDTVRRMHAATESIPIVVLTATREEELGTAAIKLGAADFLVKDETYSKMLSRSVRYSIERTNLHSELRQARRMKSLGELAGGVSHNLNNLLVPILGLSGRLTRTLVPGSEEHKDVTLIFEAAQRSSDLISRIMEFSSQIDLRTQIYDLREIIGEPLELLRSTLPSTITLNIDIAAEIEELRLDPTLIQTVVMNIVSNAVDAIADKLGEINISLARIDCDDRMARGITGLRAGPYARLSIADTGCGMDEATIDRIYDPFFTTKNVGEGTGLGLSSTLGIVTGHGGAISVNSAPGEGSTFDIYLPLPAASENE